MIRSSRAFLFAALAAFPTVNSAGREPVGGPALNSPGPSAEEAGGRSWSLGGYLKNRMGYSFQHDNPDLSIMKTELNLDVKGTLSPDWKVRANGTGSYDSAFRIEGRNQFTQDTLNVYESEVKVNDLYVDGNIGSHMNLRVGRQYFGWGETESEQISDVGNPRDFRELGLQSVEDSRLSVGATKLTFYSSSWEFNAIAIHEARPHQLGAAGSEFDPYIRARNSRTVITEDDAPSQNLRNTQFLARLFLSGGPGDVSFFGGEVFNGLPFIDFAGLDTAGGQAFFTPRYKKMRVYGFFGNTVRGSWLFKADVARKKGVALGRKTDNILEQIFTDPSRVRAWDEKNLDQWMGGMEYSGFSETRLVFEISGQHIEKHTNLLSDERNSRSLSVLLSRDFLHDKLVGTLWWSREITDKADLYRLDFSFEFSDSTKLTAGVNGFASRDEESFFNPYRKNDRFYFDFKYGF